MKVDFDIPKTARAQSGQCVEMFGSVSLLRKEERVLRWSTTTISEPFRELRISIDPSRNADAFHFDARFTMTRFKVICDAKYDVDGMRNIVRRRFHANFRRQKSGKPKLGVSR
jgi:hypothetical protein